MYVCACVCVCVHLTACMSCGNMLPRLLVALASAFMMCGFCGDGMDHAVDRDDRADSLVPRL